MQNFTSAMCDAFTTPTADGYTYVGTLTDERDGTSYVVRKYSDGHCWMASNLQYGTCANGEWTGDPYGNTSGSVGPGLYGACISRSDDDGYYYNYQAAV